VNQAKTPATAIQLGAALAALGAWGGDNTAAEHAAERERLGRSEEFYRMCLVNSLLGIVETEVMRCETAERPEDGLTIACQQALEAAGATRSDAVLLEFLRWRTLRVGLTLRQMVQKPGIGALPLAAAQAAEGLQLLLGISAAAPDLDPKAFPADDLADELYAARDALQYAIINLDKVLDPYIAAARKPLRPKYPF
jgi:uncharacterized protein DUF6245